MMSRFFEKYVQEFQENEKIENQEIQRKQTFQEIVNHQSCHPLHHQCGYFMKNSLFCHRL